MIVRGVSAGCSGIPTPGGERNAVLLVCLTVYSLGRGLACVEQVAVYIGLNRDCIRPELFEVGTSTAKTAVNDQD